MSRKLFTKQQHPDSEYGPEDYANAGAIGQLKKEGKAADVDEVLELLSGLGDLSTMDPMELLELLEELDGRDGVDLGGVVKDLLG